MKNKPHGVAFALRSRATRRGQDDEHATERWRQPATNQDPLARILKHNSDRALPQAWAAEPNNQQTYADDKPKNAVWLYLLGIVIVLYLFTLMLILFG